VTGPERERWSGERHPVTAAAWRWRRLSIAVLVGVLLALTIGPGTAGAHARLLTTSPANDEVVSMAPSAVVLTFNEPVSLAGGSAEVLDDRAGPVSGEAVQSGVEITIPLGTGGGAIADGTYTVTWEVVSADSHRITGASVFHVGAATSSGLDASQLVSQGGAGWGIRTGAVVLSTLAYAAAIVAAGLWCFGRFVARSPDGSTHRAADPLIVRATVLGLVALIAAVPFRVARVGGGLDALSDNDLLVAELRGPIGQALVVSAAGLLVLAILVERRAGAWWGVAAGAVALAGFSLEGHSRALSWRAAMIASDVVHLFAAALWVGGLVGLTLAFRSSADTTRLTAMVRRFSNAALVAVGVVTLTGVVMAWIVLPAIGELTSTGYGLALVLKVVLVTAAIGLGAFNRWLLVPVVAGADRPGRAAGAATALRPERAQRRLSRIALAELAVLVAVVATAAVLVTRSPLSTDAAGPPTTGAPEVIAVALSDGAGTAEVTVSPGRIGSNRVGVVLRDVEGRIVNPIEAPVVEFTQVAADVGPLRPDVRAVDIGRYELDTALGVAGSWEVLVRVRVSDFASATGSTTVVIG